MSEPKIGDLWRDRDSRMSGRTVRIEDIAGGRVHYRHKSGRGTLNSSKVERFVKAFALVDIDKPAPAPEPASGEFAEETAIIDAVRDSQPKCEECGGYGTTPNPETMECGSCEGTGFGLFDYAEMEAAVHTALDAARSHVAASPVTVPKRDAVTIIAELDTLAEKATPGPLVASESQQYMTGIPTTAVSSPSTLWPDGMSMMLEVYGQDFPRFGDSETAETNEARMSAADEKRRANAAFLVALWNSWPEIRAALRTPPAAPSEPVTVPSVSLEEFDAGEQRIILRHLEAADELCNYVNMSASNVDPWKLVRDYKETREMVYALGGPWQSMFAAVRARMLDAGKTKEPE